MENNLINRPKKADEDNEEMMVDAIKASVRGILCGTLYYRPQTKIMFLHLCVILFTGGRGVCIQGRLGRPRGWADPPWMQTPQGWADIPLLDADPPGVGQIPWMQTPLPGLGRAPPIDPPIRSTSGRYASYWNAFLFFSNFTIPYRAGFFQVLGHCTCSLVW